ncbi:MAG: phospholipase D-like domain-containing anti-phage protein [Thermomicrobiales bacterium]
MITRHSSRRTPLHTFLPDLLGGATAYDRIAGYFSSSILEVAGEALEGMAEGARARVVCNSELDPLDVLTARAAKQAMTREWKASLPDDVSPALRARLDRLYGFLVSGRLAVRVLPDNCLGLIHGKAGVIRRAHAPPIAFMGSANESRRAWQLNYEIVWTDDSPEGIQWVQEEFDALWAHPAATDLAEAVVQDVVRLVRRVVVPELDDWQRDREADAAATVELPVYRRENGLWAHQKWFVRHAFDLHKQGGARLVLADQVGLGKTVQLALAAKLMALWGGGRVLALVPKPLLPQWRDELWNLLRLPSAIWTGQGWEDEREVFHPLPIHRSPRRVALVSTSQITKQGADVRDALSSLSYECIILDEAHHARRSNRGPTHKHEGARPNNLLHFLYQVAGQTRSLLLATATPVQIDPIEAWDLLHALNMGNSCVLGTMFSRWETRPRAALDLVLGREVRPDELGESWEWIRDPLPPPHEAREFDIIRAALHLPDDRCYAKPEALDRLGLPDRARLRDLARVFFDDHNPFIRHIVRRTRDYLENTLDPHTNEPYLAPIRVRLFGEEPDESVPLPTFLRDAYEAAAEFCEEVGQRPGLNAGFLETLLLRRVGSTIIAGRKTAERMLGPERDAGEEEDDSDEEPRSKLYPLLPNEEEKLRLFLRLLENAREDDPKYRAVERILLDGLDGTGPWLDLGCIVFSQYYDSARWIAERLSGRLPEETVALYAGSGKSGVLRGGELTRIDREAIKQEVRAGAIKLVIGTDAASEGLNLQRLGTLVNLDLPWNPTRLEQRKGRIQRIGQVRDEVYIANLRYRGSVEDRVHQLLSARLKAISDLFGQLPDTLEDVWVNVALRDEEKARQVIDEVPEQHPFEMRYDRVEAIDWETCSRVLDSQTQLDALMAGW